jgi:hypothetical protein
MGKPKAEVAPKQAPLYRTIPYLSDHKCGVCKKTSSSRWYALLADASNIICNVCHSKETNERCYPSKACASCNIESSSRWYGGPSAGTKLCQKCHSKQQAPVPPLTCAIVQTQRGIVAFAETNTEVSNEGSAAVLLTSLKEQRDAAQALGIPPNTLDEDGGAAETELETGSGKVQGLLESGSQLVGGPLMALPAPGGPQGLLESAPSLMGGSPVALLSLGAPEKEAGSSALAHLRSAEIGEPENEQLALVPVEQTGASAPGETPTEPRRAQDPPGSRTRSAGKSGGGAKGAGKRPARDAAASPGAKRAKEGAKENNVSKPAESNALSVVVSKRQGGPVIAAATTPVKLCGDCGKESTGKWYVGTNQCSKCYDKARRLKSKQEPGSTPKELKTPPSDDQKTAHSLEESGHAPSTAKKGKKRKLAENPHGAESPPGTKKKATPQPVSSEPGVCADCGTKETSSWHAGPGGPRTRCRKCHDLCWGGPCHLCAATSTCVWYGGPNGPRTTCSKCYRLHFRPITESMSNSVRPAVRKRSLREIEERSPSTSGRSGEGTLCVVQPRKDGSAGRKPSRAELVSHRVSVWWPMDKT